MVAENTSTKQTQCCIAGGGPAGMMLGLLLARSGVQVTVLEKHKDFFRDFRGDTIHPSTIQLIYELGWLDEFLKVPHQNLPKIKGTLGPDTITLADFSHLPVHEKYIALMPQWDFLNFISEKAKQLPTFTLLMESEATSLIIEGGTVKGIKAKTLTGDIEIRAELTVACDGRSSILRDQAGLKLIEEGVPIDVLWFRIPRPKEVTDLSLGYIKRDKFMVLLDRNEYLQCAYVIAKGKFEAVKAQGLEQFRKSILEIVPFLSGVVDAVNNWDDVKLLSVQINHLEKWYREGLLCIGDAAHAMSPVGGVGVNLAVQDAVATAHILADAFQKGKVSTETLLHVQMRRERPARFIQGIQAFIHNRVFNPSKPSKNESWMKIPVWIFRLFPFLSRIPARVIGMGIRPEHIRP